MDFYFSNFALFQRAFYAQQVRPPQQQRMQMLQQQNVYPLMYMPSSQLSGDVNRYGAPILNQHQPGQIQQMMVG